MANKEDVLREKYGRPPIDEDGFLHVILTVGEETKEYVIKTYEGLQ